MNEYKKINKIEILKDFVKYCFDLKLKTNKNTSKIKYVNNYMIQYAKMHGIKDFEEVQKEVVNALRYNSLHIAKYEEDMKKGVL